MSSDDYTGTPPKGWPRYPNDVTGQAAPRGYITDSNGVVSWHTPDYAGILDRLDRIANALQPRFVEFLSAHDGEPMAFSVGPGMLLIPKGPDTCYIGISPAFEEGWLIKGSYDENLAKLRGAQ